MYFQAGLHEVILFSEWETNGIWSLLGSMVAIFILAFVLEAMTSYRQHLIHHQHDSSSVVSSTIQNSSSGAVEEENHTQKGNATKKVKMLGSAHLIQTFLHLLQLIVTYLLMLIFMTGNVWLCLAIVLGSGTGYFAFSWKTMNH